MTPAFSDGRAPFSSRLTYPILSLSNPVISRLKTQIGSVMFTGRVFRLKSGFRNSPSRVGNSPRFSATRRFAVRSFPGARSKHYP
jgi:hypothetical protein